MSAHVLLNLLNELRKSNKMHIFAMSLMNSIILDSINHNMLNLLRICVKTSSLRYICDIVIGVIS